MRFFRNPFVVMVLMFLGVTTLHGAGAILLPITQDEAYYLHWARFIDFGYFDHPPLIAWLTVPGQWLGDPRWARAIPVILAMLSFPISVSLFRHFGINSPKRTISAALLFHFSLFGLMFGVLATPDMPLAFFWLCALHEAVAAIEGNPKRWLTAGLFTGLGLLSKFTMLLMGPVFLWALLFEKRQLRTPWPYIGGVVAFLVFAPHLYWNHQNDWITFRFQLNRGLMHSHDVSGEFGRPLPAASPKVFDEQGVELAQYFLAKEKIKKPKEPKSAFQKFYRRVSEYWSGQLVVWGLFLIPLGLGLSKVWRHRHKKQSSPREVLVIASALVPLLIFGLLAFFQRVEANWPAPYIIGASILISRWFFHRNRAATWAALGHGVLVLGLFFHGSNPFPVPRPGGDRVLRETHGFSELASFLRKEGMPIYGETYQLTSAISAYLPRMVVSQWPGLTRESEITRRDAMYQYNFRELKSMGGFQLVTSAMKPPLIEPFEVTSMLEFRNCLGKFEIHQAGMNDDYQPGCERPVHRWFIYRYGLAKHQS